MRQTELCGKFEEFGKELYKVICPCYRHYDRVRTLKKHILKERVKYTSTCVAEFGDIGEHIVLPTFYQYYRGLKAFA